MRTKTFFLLFALFTGWAAKAVPPVEEGKSIFTTRCAACHNVNKILVGPALAGVDTRHSIDWIVNFVHSSQTVIKKGDPAAVALFNKFNHIQMPNHPDLSEGQIKNIVEYIKTEAKSAKEATAAAPTVRPENVRPIFPPLSSANAGFYVTLFALAVLLIAVLLFAVQVKQYQRRMSSGQ